MYFQKVKRTLFAIAIFVVALILSQALIGASLKSIINNVQQHALVTLTTAVVFSWFITNKLLHKIPNKQLYNNIKARPQKQDTITKSTVIQGNEFKPKD